MMKLFYLCFFLSAAFFAAFAGDITIDFPKFAGKDYVYYFVRGDGNDTVMRGTLDLNGQAKLSPYLSDKNFCGTSRFIISGAGGFEIFLNGEKDFTVECDRGLPLGTRDIRY
ncbi:MAG: hypothetical protein LBF79_03215, partial [Dysgonamonadaceae bacterium]|nr:hypothetical protein [Dysgonamonadaceae bacterium]